MAAWIFRGGAAGEREQWALENNIVGGGWHRIGDLTEVTSRDALRQVVEQTLTGEPPGRHANYTGQLWAMRDSIKPGDLIVMPMKTTKKIAFGICTQGYHYAADEPDPTKRHLIGVDWKRSDVSRAAIKDDLLNTLNGAMTVFQASKNRAEDRLRATLVHGVDPGSAAAPNTSAPAPTTHAEPAADVVDPAPVPTLDAIRDRVLTYLRENFKKGELEHLVADILRANGYVCDVSPEGPDFGVDIIGGAGVLGLDSPTFIAEVKSEETQVGAPVVRSLQGAMASHKADQGLLVAWGGLNNQARQAIRNDRLRIRVWDAEDVLDHLFAVYDQLPPTTRSALPLKRVWVLDADPVAD